MNIKRMKQWRIWGLVLPLWLLSGMASAEIISDIANTRHNFSATLSPLLSDNGGRRAQASTESQICIFCHTPHGAAKQVNTPIWNRQLDAAAQYTPYNSTSMDATDQGQQPGGRSRLCLSCHDGVLALGSVNNAQTPIAGAGKVVNPIDFQGPGIDTSDKVPAGLGANTGFTRRLGTDLSNDHPISITFDDAQAQRDGELYPPSSVAHLGKRSNRDNLRPKIPLDDNKVECISCHDPHVRDTAGGNAKFLRVNRFQKNTPAQGQFDQAGDIICLACHNKSGWAGSAHANPQVATYQYTGAAANLREFPSQQKVWQAACLNCHDPHTVQGSRRLLREGVDGGVQQTRDGAFYKQGGQPAIEQTCYACHSSDGGVLQGQGGATFGVPNIKTDFSLPRHMPITSQDQLTGREVHSIGTGGPSMGTTLGADFVEDPKNQGKNDLNNRHAECTDCHNPHRLQKNRLFYDNNLTPDDAGTHPHTEAQLLANGLTEHKNFASGVLRGISGVEPVYADTRFGSEPVGFKVKKGDPNGNPDTAASAPYVSREYQVCMKCHSNNAYNTPPDLGYYPGGTPTGTNSMLQYTNQAMEYQSPPAHAGEGTASGTGAFEGAVDAAGNTVDYRTNNHRAWHPVMRPTGRTPEIRKASRFDWKSPFNLGVGTQTMYCTDCHGNATAAGEVVPDGGVDGRPWGPHGSRNTFLLKGPWDANTGETTLDGLCFKCHDYDNYANETNTLPKNSGFSMATNQPAACLSFKGVNLHIGHAKRIPNFRCTFCHVAVPHGWKNKVFLANLNDVGKEAPLLAGEPAGQQGQRQVRNNTTQRYYNGPYYNGSVLKVKSFARSGNWVQANCGSAGAPGNGVVGQSWMSNSSESCLNPP